MKAIAVGTATYLVIIGNRVLGKKTVNNEQPGQLVKVWRDNNYPEAVLAIILGGEQAAYAATLQEL